ncbi:MAG: YCF48-related protein [Chloracidobacterium sp.]|uniref:SPOR domain-containing protein n=1 Tax=Chloracidobacterium validum TaxID=2821543 RepID=A0ABX8BAK8_9BACT|nr:YCF48-related protein [Chloracidobacterium validum]QUW03066.1 SPOR domain-containing protein [Chloracidobacterium validum]
MTAKIGVKVGMTLGRALLGLCLLWLTAGGGYGQGRAHTVQVASVNDETVARETVAGYRGRGVTAYYVKVELPQGTYYRIRVGRFTTAAEAQRYARAIGVRDAFITMYDGPPDAPVTRAPETSPKATASKSTNVAAAGSTPSSPTLPPPVMVIKPKGQPAPLPPATTLPGPDSPTGQVVSPADAAPPAAPGRQLPWRAERPALLFGDLTAPAAPAGMEFRTDPSPWTRLSTPTRADLHCAHFVNPQIGWVGGRRGVILHTEDSGQRWIEQVTGTTANVTGLFFLDADTGWAAVGGTYGLDPRVAGIEPAILHTNDGGRVWRPLAELDVRALWFVNKQVGFAVGNYSSVFRTTDGGATWTPCEGIARAIERPEGLPDAVLTFTQVQFLDERRGWVAGNFLGRGVTRPGGVFFTSDGGTTWTRCPIPFAATSADITSMRFIGARRGFVVSELYRGDARFVTLHFTNDGGATWSERRTAVPGFHVTHFLDERTGWTMGALLTREGSAPPYEVGIWVTRDGGRTWREEKTLAGTQIYGAFFLDDQTGWAVGQGGTVLRYRP